MIGKKRKAVVERGASRRKATQVINKTEALPTRYSNARLKKVLSDALLDTSPARGPDLSFESETAISTLIVYITE